MGDHLFAPELLDKLVLADQTRGMTYLLVDRQTEAVFELQDATKVRLDGSRIIDIGKDVTPFDAVDTGLFLCQPTVFEALRRAQSEGEDSLSGGIRKLARQGLVEEIDSADHFWLDVDTPAGLRHAHRRLLADSFKASGDGWISRYLNRPVSLRISERLADLPVIPNQITIASALTAAAAAVLFSFGGRRSTVAGGMLSQVASILDGCDGEIARLKHRSSAFGGWFDTILDRYADVAITCGIARGFARTHPRPATWLGASLAITGFLLASYTKKEYQLQYREAVPESPVANLIKRDVRLFSLFLGGLVNRPYEALLAVGMLSHAGIAGLFIQRVRETRRGRRDRRTFGSMPQWRGAT